MPSFQGVEIQVYFITISGESWRLKMTDAINLALLVEEAEQQIKAFFLHILKTFIHLSQFNFVIRIYLW